GLCRQRRVERNGCAGAFTSSVRNGVVDIDGPPEVDGPKQEHKEHRGEHGELHHRLTAVAAQDILSHQYSALKTALVLMVSWPFASPTSCPMIGVMKVNLKLACTVIGYPEVPLVKLSVL